MFSSVFIMVNLNYNAEGYTGSYDSIEYNSHAPIRIDSNINFDGAQGVTGGNGTVWAPWIIEGYEIDGTDASSCIYLGNTTDHFIVQDCYLHHASGIISSYHRESGIELHNVSNGYLLNNTASYCENSGIYLDSSSNITINGTIADENYAGVFVYSSSNNNTVTNSTITSSIFDARGIAIQSNSNYNTVLDNSIDMNDEFLGIYLGDAHFNDIGDNIISESLLGIDLLFSSNNFVYRNEIYGCPSTGINLAMMSKDNEIKDNTVSDNVYGIDLGEESNNNIIVNNTLSSSYYGIRAYDSHENRIKGNTIFNTRGCGVYTNYANYTIFENNTINSNDFTDITVYNSHNNVISNNTLFESGSRGISLEYTDDSVIDNNEVYDHDHVAIFLAYSDNNLIVNNAATDDLSSGLELIHSNGCEVYHNVFMNNLLWQAFDNTGNNDWDNGYPEGGNFWGDYSGVDLKSGSNQDLPGSDGFGDSPYASIGGESGAVDNYPIIDLPGGVNPTSNVEPISPYFYWVSPLTISANANDDFSGIYNLTLWYRHSHDNSTWNNWTSSEVDVDTPWSWSFDYPSGEGYYEFYSVAVDGANNSEPAPLSADTSCTFFNQPEIILNSPSNNSMIAPGTVINFTIIDDTLLHVIYTINEGENQTLDSPYDITTNDWPDGFYTVEIIAEDAYGYLTRAFYAFIIDGTCPEVINVTPMSDISEDIYVDLNTTIVMVFSESMSAFSTRNSFILVNETGEIDGTASMNVDDSVLTFTPSTQLEPGVTYSATVDTSARDKIGHHLEENYSWSFSTWPDSDRDGIIDIDDPDDDNDGVLDDDDALPFDPTETMDSDSDGIGDIADTDDDNDGVLDDEDAFPFDSTESLDTDGDGIGNNADPDDDDDGVLDTEDFDPLDPDVTTDPNAPIGGSENYWWVVLVIVIVAVFAMIFLFYKKQKV